MPEKLLEVKALRAAFRIHGKTIEAVRGVDFDIAPGEIVGLVGESGSGKSVTMKSIIRMLPESARMSAEILRFDGCDLTGLTEKQMEYLPPGMIGIPMVHGAHELRSLYTAADICLSLSYEESQGLTLIEALACGTQVVCYDQTALPEIVTEDTGLVVHAGDIQAVADACRKLLEEPKSPDACRARACAFDRDTQFEKYVGLYEELLGYGTQKER